MPLAGYESYNARFDPAEPCKGCLLDNCEYCPYRDSEREDEPEPDVCGRYFDGR